MKARVEAGGETFEEAVTVNQRGLIDKILARYSTELTLFRELLQNANDAKATKLQIRFSGTSFWETVRGDVSKDTDERRRKKALSYTGLRICNNGMVFRDQDWARIKSIADGNPDETKVGFFGVGFYSVFSISDEPTVLSGDKALSFHWKKDALFVTHGKIPDSREDDAEEDKAMFNLVRKDSWTVFDLPVRRDPPFPSLPSPDKLIEFLARCLSFTTSLESVQVFYDGEIALTVGRKVTGEPEPLAPALVHGLQVKDPRGMFHFSKAFMEPLLYVVQSFDRKDPLVTEMMRVQADFDVTVDERFAAAMFRVTKKNPPKQISMQLLFDITESFLGRKSAASEIFETFSPASERGGYFFIGSGITQQSTGSKCHCQAPFMPTMERNAMDFSDVTLATWNRALLWVTGALQRLSYEHRCSLAKVSVNVQPNKRQLEGKIENDDKGDSSTDNNSVAAKEDEVDPNAQIVFRSMAIFAIKPTTPVEQVGEIVSAGFFKGLEKSPTVWSTRGPKEASLTRMKDSTGLHELVTTTVSVVVLPENPKDHAVEDNSLAETLSKQARSAFGFFSSLLGSSSSSSSASESREKKTTASQRDHLASLCRLFVDELLSRRVLRELDVRDLATELSQRSLQDEEQVVTLLRWLIKREKTFQSLRRYQDRQSQPESILCHCNWCGKGLPISRQDIEREKARQLEELSKTAQGMFSRLASSFGGTTTTQAVRVPIKCSRCSHVTYLDADETTSNELSSLVISTSFTSQHLLEKAKFRGVALKSFRRLLPRTLVQRIQGSCEKGMAEKLDALFWSNGFAKQQVLPQAISKHFADEELVCLDERWLVVVEWVDWLKTCYQVLNGKQPPLGLEDLALASNVIRVLSFARQRGEMDRDQQAYVISAMSSMQSVPVSSHRLMKPLETYLGEESTGGFSSLPIVAMCEALEDGSFHMNKNTPRDAAVVDMLRQLGVKEHVDLAYVFEEFNKGTLGWNRQEVLRYIASLRAKLDANEVGRLKKAEFLPALEIRDGNCFPTLKSFEARKLHFPTPELAEMQIPLVYPIPDEGLPLHKNIPSLDQVDANAKSDHEKDSEKTDHAEKAEKPSRSFFDAFGETSSQVINFLKELGVQSHPTLDTVLYKACQPGPTQAPALRYLVTNFSLYRSSYRPSSSARFIPCTNGRLESPLHCFSNPKAELLGKPLVDISKLNAKHAAMLEVRENPSPREVLKSLEQTPPSPEKASAVFEYLASLLSTMSKSDMERLRMLAFVPIQIKNDSNTADNKKDNAQYFYASPATIFFRPTDETGKYEGLFPYVNFGSEAANMFLRSVGVRNEPSVDELAAELATGRNAEKHVERVGFANYLHVLRLIAVEWSSISSPTKRKMAAAKCLVGQQADETEPASTLTFFDSKTEESEDMLQDSMKGGDVSLEDPPQEQARNVTYSLQTARQVYICDNDVYDRMFRPVIVPQENLLEFMYHELGSRYLSSAVRTNTKPRSPYRVNDKTAKLADLIRKRVNLFLFKRKDTDFAPDIKRWLSTISAVDKPFVLMVPMIERTIELDGVVKQRSCSAFALNTRQRALLVTAEFSLFECAAELCNVLLRKSTPHDQLLWGTILQSSEQVLREQGFPVQRMVVTEAPKKPTTPHIEKAATVEKPTSSSDVVTTAASSAPPAPPPQPPTKGPSAPPLPVPAPAPQEPRAEEKAPANDDAKDLMSDEMMEKMVKKASGLKKSGSFFRQFLSSVPKSLGKSPTSKSDASNNNSSKVAPPKAPEQGPKEQIQQQIQQQMQQQQGQRQGAKGSLMVDRDSRRQAMMQALRSCNTGGGESVIQSHASQQPMVSVMDDLHEHNLVKTRFKFAGMECFVEKDPSGKYSDEAMAKIFEVKAFEATAFAQLLDRIATEVFGVDGSVCHLYYHFEGPTAAFNRGGALYFNFYVFLEQLSAANWRIETVVQSGRQPLLLPPSEAFIDWFGVFAHELSHNHIHVHDANFANWMMMYMTGFMELFHALLEQNRVILQR